MSTPASHSLTCFAAAAGLGPVSAAAAVREMENDSVCPGSRLTSWHFSPLTGKYDHCKISPPPSIYRYNSRACSKRILMSLKLHTQLYSSHGSLKLWFILPHDTLHLFREYMQHIICFVPWSVWKKWTEPPWHHSLVCGLRFWSLEFDMLLSTS